MSGIIVASVENPHRIGVGIWQCTKEADEAMLIVDLGG
jgi:hypothetical protein